MARRSAATLVEVLVAIFVMGIGLLALLTLFPIGIISMAQAIQDERAYQCATMASALANATDIRHDPWVLQDWQYAAGSYNPALNLFYPTGNLGGNDVSIGANAVTDAYTDPNPAALYLAEANGSSYPLFVDPIGFYTSAVSPNWVGGAAGVNILARRRVSFTRGPIAISVTGTPFTPFPVPLWKGPGVPWEIYQPGTPIPPPNPPSSPSPIYPAGAAPPQSVPLYPQPYPYPPPPPSGTSQLLLNESVLGTLFTLTDDVVFNTVGDPTTAPPIQPGTAALANPAALTTLLRDTRFSWAYVCQRPANGSTDIVNLTVVVFSKRPLALGATLSLPEYVYNYNPGTPNAVTPPASPALSNTTYFDPINNIITIDYTNNVPPPLRPGDWIMDVTQACTRRVNPTNPSLPTTDGTWTPHGYFYRVVSFNELQDTIAGTQRTLAQYEVTPRLRGFTITDNAGTIIPVFPVYAPPTSTTSGPGKTSPPYGQGPWLPANGWATPPTPSAVVTGNSINLGYAGSSVVFDGVVRVFEVGAGRNR